MQNTQKNACNLKKFQYNKGEKPDRTSTDIFWKEGELMYKKRFLRLVSAVLALCMMAALLPAAAFAADPEPKPTPASSFTFSYDKDTKTASVTGFTGSETEIIIPGTVKYDGETYPVTSIGESAFHNCSALTSVTIPSSVTSIEWRAFSNCDKLTSVTFDENSQLTSIGEDAFAYCSALTSVTIPSGVTSIGNSAFYNCSTLRSVTFDKNSQLTNIGEDAFGRCGSLSGITIPASVTKIGVYAFSKCSKLSSVNFEENSKLTGIPEGMLNECGALKSIELPAGITSIGKTAFRLTGLTSIKIPEGVTTIGEKAFMYCYALQTVTIPASVQSLANNIFTECKIAKNIQYSGTEKQWENLKFDPTGTNSPEITISYLRTVQFDPNGHGTAPENVYVKNGETIDCPTLSETGYNLDGWYYTEDGVEKEFKFGKSGTKVTSSMTLKAMWSPISYQLTVDGSAEGHDYDEEVTVDEPTKEGYTFAGWTVEAGNVTPKKGDDGKWSFKMPAGNVTLTAKWEINRYTVKFMNGEDEVKSITADYNSTIAINDAPVAPVKEGYVFGGWYSGSEKFVFGETKVTSDLTLTAKWTKGSYTLTVDGSAEGHDYDEEVTVDEPTKEGYTFAGWTVEAGNVTPKKGDDGKWSFKMPAGNVTLTAKWKINEYTVIFVTAYDNTPNALTVKHGETIAGDRVLKADGYEFGGWYNGTEKFVFGENGTKVTSNLTLTARWTEVKKPEPKPEPTPVVYEIVVDNGTAYLDDGATAIHTAEEGQTVILKVNPEALTEGFAFDKWEIVSGDVKLADETASETSFEMPASAVELKATVKAVEIPAAPAAIDPASVVVGTVVLGAGAVSVGWSAYHIATELYLKWMLPQGIIPTTRGQLALLLWKQADQPAAESTALYTDIDASDEQTAARWVIENKKMELVNSDEADVFEPDLPVDIFAVAKAWRNK